MGEEDADLAGPHFIGMPLSMKEDEPANPSHIGLLGPNAVMPNANRRTNLIEQSRLAISSHESPRRCHAACVLCDN
jgi:hypothetical protein